MTSLAPELFSAPLEALTGERLAAFDRAQAMSMPTAVDEVWRYSRIGDLRLDRYRAGTAQTSVDLPPGVTHTQAGLDEGAVDTSLTIHDVFDELAVALGPVETMTIASGTVVPEPLVITHRLADEGTASFPRLIVDAGEDSEITVIECFESPDDLDALLVPRVQINAGPAARVRYLAINLLGTKTWAIGHQQAVSARDTTVLLGNVALGGHYARVRTDVRAEGVGASTRQIALYYADGEQMHDFRTLQDHLAPRTTSDLLFKGAVQDTAKSVYTGLIRIGEEAAGSAAFQTNRNLTLSEGAWAESVPNLDIATNDVRCSHASSIGPIDDEQRYYLESRGIPPVAAERLIVLGFFDEVLGMLPVDAARRADLHARVAEKLNRR